MGTNISAYPSTSVVLSAFSLFTAYQILSPGKLDYAPESKMRPYPSCVCQCFAPTWWKGSRRDFSLLTAYQILSAEFILKIVLDNGAIVSYNTTPAEEGWRCSLLCLTTCLSSLGLKLTTYRGRRGSSLFSMQSFPAGGSNSEHFYHPEIMTTYQSFCTWIWPHLWP